MKQEIQPPEFSNPLEINRAEIYRDVRAFTGRDVRRMAATVIEASLLLVACNGPASPTHTASPDNIQAPLFGEVTPTATIPTETPKTIPTPEPTETPVPTEVHVPRQVELVFAQDNITVPDSCKVIPDATPENTLTLNGQPLPDGTVIDTYQNITSITSGVYHRPTLLIAARAVAIEKLTPDPDIGWEDPYLLCYNVTLPSGDNIVFASVFNNSTQSGFQNTGVYELPGTDVASVTLDQTVEQSTPIKVIHNSDFLALFTSGKIIGQQVLLLFAYDYPSTDRAVGENSWRGAIVAALKAGQLPQEGHLHSVYETPIGGEFIVPENLVP